MSKRIIVHLSSNWKTSNFGDVLFAEMLVEHLVGKGYQVALFDASPFVKSYLYEIKKLPKYEFGITKADACLYFAGGYFGESRDSKLALHLIHFYRFMIFGIYAMLLRKKLAVIGIGAGDYLWPLSRLVVKNVCKKANVVTTRDNESTMFLERTGNNGRIITCSDVAQTIDVKRYLEKSIDWLDNDSHKYIFLHVNNEEAVNCLFVDGVAPFLSRHPEYRVIIGNDYLPKNASNYKYAVSVLGQENVVNYKYSCPEELCSVLGKSKVVLTFKLHVGIIASTMGCSVLSFSRHEKIPRYFSQIGYPERCIPFYNSTPEIVERQLELFAEKPICVPDEILHLANDNWKYMDGFLDKL